MTSIYSLPGQMTIIDAVCKVWGVTPEQLRSNSRKHLLPEPRKVVAYYYRDILKRSWVEAGRAIGKDHASAMDAQKKFYVFMEVDPEFREKANLAIGYASPKYSALSVKNQLAGEVSEVSKMYPPAEFLHVFRVFYAVQHIFTHPGDFSIFPEVFLWKGGTGGNISQRRQERKGNF